MLLAILQLAEFYRLLTIRRKPNGASLGLHGDQQKQS